MEKRLLNGKLQRENEKLPFRIKLKIGISKIETPICFEEHELLFFDKIFKIFLFKIYRCFS